MRSVPRECRDALLARDQGGELAQIECEAGRGTRAAERFADAVVALATPDRIGFAGGENRKARAGLVVIAAQVREVDVQARRLLDAAARASVVKRGQSAVSIDGVSGRRSRAAASTSSAGPYSVGSAVNASRHAAGRRAVKLGDRRDVLGAQRREELRVGAVAGDVRAVGERAIDADVAEIEVQAAHAGRSER